jgi:hypothetical protein
MLKGEAKTRYMRDYMRRRRAQQAGQLRPQVDPAVGDPATSEVQQRLETQVGELEAEVARLMAENAQLRAKKHSSKRSSRDWVKEEVLAEVGKPSVCSSSKN